MKQTKISYIFEAKVVCTLNRQQIENSLAISEANGKRRVEYLKPGDTYELILEKKNNSLGLNVTV